MDRGEVVGLDDELPLLGEAHAEDVAVRQESGGEGARVGRSHEDAMRDVIEQFTDGMQIAEREQSTIVQDDDLLGDALDF